MRRFKLEFVFFVSAEGSRVWERVWEGRVSGAANKGPLGFLESPPSVSFVSGSVN